MKVAIVEHPRMPSPDHFNDIAPYPLWSCLMAGYAGAALMEAGVDTEILDLRYQSFPEMVRAILDSEADVLAVHAVYFWEGTENLFDTLRHLRREGYKNTICLFGFFPSLCGPEILEAFPEVDFVIAGEPEATIVEMAWALAGGEDMNIPGLYSRKEGKPGLMALRPLQMDPDRIPSPWRPHLEEEQTVSILASRGCYNGCSFCLIPALGGGRNPWRSRSVGHIVKEIDDIRQKGKTDFYFVDPNFIGPGRAGRERVIELASRLAPLNITFGMETRAMDLTPEVMTELRQAGLQSLLLGLESGCESVLGRIGKNTSPERNLLAVEEVRRAGLEPEIGFIMFEPQSNLKEVAHNFNFLRDARLLDRLGRTANLLYHHQIILKGTRLYQNALEEQRLTPHGLFGFEGIPRYRDWRVQELARTMKRICLWVLGEMGRRGSSIHWSRESTEAGLYQSLNQMLVTRFEDLLTGVAHTENPSDFKADSLANETIRQMQFELDDSKIPLPGSGGDCPCGCYNRQS